MRVRKRKRFQFFIVLLLLGILLILFAAVLLLRLRGSVALKPSKLELPAQSITAYRQDEAAWADDLLGESSYTMASSGCLVTCIASAVSMETGTAITPGSLNAIFQRIMYMTVRGTFSGRRWRRWKDLQPMWGKRYRSQRLTHALPRDMLRLCACGCMDWAVSIMC